MAFNKKPGETGWFYHAPAKPKPQAEPVGVPPPSQIPGLDGQKPDPDYQDDFKRIQIKETDSPYIRLAKQGGRPNLLQMREPKPASREPKGYPRVDWFYDEDPDEKKTQGDKYRFLLPDYMVHEDNPELGCDYKPKRSLLSQDDKTAYNREESQANDKTVKLPELTPHGHGVRTQKAKSSGKKEFDPVPKRSICKPPSPSIGPVTQYKAMPTKKNDDVIMGKLLSMGYLDDWRQDRDKWQRSQDASSPRLEKPVTEYQESHLGRKPKNSSNNARPVIQHQTKLTAYEEKKLAEDRELFKLSKYKNVPAKTNTHRATQHGAADQAPVVAPVAN